MANLKDDRLRARLAALEEQLHELEAAIPENAPRAHIGETYVPELERMTATEAAEHLGQVDDSRVTGAYLILSKSLEPATLAEICLDYLRRPGHNARLTGALGIGTCLKRTFDRNVSDELARIVRDPGEAEEVRSAAYSSLLLINCGQGSGVPRALCKQQQEDDTLRGVDWAIVDSFLW